MHLVEIRGTYPDPVEGWEVAGLVMETEQAPALQLAGSRKQESSILRYAASCLRLLQACDGVFGTSWVARSRLKILLFSFPDADASRGWPPPSRPSLHRAFVERTAKLRFSRQFTLSARGNFSSPCYVCCLLLEPLSTAGILAIDCLD